jgi:hypothetical protein
LKTTLRFYGEARGEATTLVQKRQRDAGTTSGQAPVGQGALGTEPDLAAALRTRHGSDDGPVLLAGEPLGMRMHRETGWAGRHRGGTGAEDQPEAVVDELGALDRQTKREAVVVDDSEIVAREPMGFGCGVTP